MCHPATHPSTTATDLQEVQLAGCRKQLGIVQREYDYIKDQLTTTEVRGVPLYSPLGGSFLSFFPVARRGRCLWDVEEGGGCGRGRGM